MAADTESLPPTVPTAKFIKNVEDYLAGRTPEAAIQALDANYRNYRLIERNLLQSKARQMGKLPEIQKAEEAVALLMRKRDEAQEVSIARIYNHDISQRRSKKP
ncbi:Prefoldin subunit 3 [Trebouxia sp. C0010 RCD-2024]